MGNNFEVKMNEYLPLRDVVFNTLRQAILKGELAPGERLMEIQLAQKLGVRSASLYELDVKSTDPQAAIGKVYMLCPNGKKQNINGEERIQDSLWRQYFQNKNCLCLILEIPNPTDYMKIVSYYAGDC